MSLRLRILCLAGLALGLSTLPACSKSSGKQRVAIVTNCTADFWTICHAGAGKAAKELDVELDFRQPVGNTVADQKEMVDAVTSVGVSGVAVSVINPAEQSEYLRRIAAKQNLIAMDNDAPDSGRKYYVGIDNYEAGKALGRLMKERMPQGGTFVLFIGTTASANAQARMGGVKDELAGEKDAKGPQYGKFTLHGNAPLTDGADEGKAMENAKTVIELLKDVPNVALVGLYAYNPKKNLHAYRSKKNDLKNPMKMFGFDEDEATLEGIKNGEIEGTVVQNPFLYGYNSVKILATLGKGETISPTEVKALTVIPYRVVTRDGGPEKEVNGIKVLNIKAVDLEQQLKADKDSAK